MRIVKLTSGCLIAAALAACATNQGNGTLIGAGGGALLGAGIGALAGGKTGAVVGAGVGAAGGAVAGSVIGHYMDKQEAALKNVKGAKVERQGDKLSVHFNSAILFDTNKSLLKPAAENDLGEFAKVLRDYPETEIVVAGHTDNVGKKAKNQKLSVARAESVAHFLEAKGVEARRMATEGHADDVPVADNSTEAGRQQNRRVQIEIKANEKLRQQDAAGGAQGGAQPAQPAPRPHG
jgi:outer membrane protein OmpA-like peptidoglycan-associated protein